MTQTVCKNDVRIQLRCDSIGRATSPLKYSTWDSSLDKSKNSTVKQHRTLQMFTYFDELTSLLVIDSLLLVNDFRSSLLAVDSLPLVNDSQSLLLSIDSLLLVAEELIS